MSNEDTNLLKLDMQIIAKRLKLRDKTGNLLLNNASLLKKNDKQLKNDTPSIVCSKQLKEKQQKKFPKKRKVIFRRPVGYTWNRGGRLKELRIRTQARKFLYLWIQKTFGRLVFSTASKFYNLKILHKCFRSLKANWWENCGEMKLFVRAEYFYKYQIYGKVWIAWTSFTKLSKLKNQRNALASRNCTLTIYKKIIKQWKTYIRLKKMKKQLYDKGYAISKNNMMKKCWNVWAVSLECEYRLKQNCEIAICHHDNALLGRILNLWKCKCLEALHTKEKILLAQKQENLTLQKRFFCLWQNYVAYRHKSYNLYEKAKKLYNLSMKHRTLCLWWTRYENLLCKRKQIHACHTMGLKSTKRRYFLAWLEFVAKKDYERRQQAISVIFHRRILMKNGLKKFRINASINKRKILMRFAAQDFYKNVLLRSAWTNWENKLEIIEEREMSEISSVAREHYRWKLVKRSFLVLFHYKNWRKSQKQKKIQAEAHFVFKALPRCFAAWRRFVDEMKDVNEMKRDARHFNNEVLLTKFFYMWSSAFEEAKENRIRERLAVMQHTENCLRHHYSLWLRKTRLILSTNHDDAVARVHYRRSLLKCAIKSWSEFTRNSLLKEKKWNYAGRHHRSKMRTNAWMTWTQYVIRCRQKRRKLSSAALHHETRVMQKCVESWKSHVVKTKEISDVADRKFAKKRETLIASAFEAWRRFTKLTRIKNATKEKADNFRSSRLLIHGLGHWRSWTALRRFKTTQTQQQLLQAREILHQTKLRVLCANWFRAAVVVRRERLQVERASMHYCSRVCRVAFQAWQLHKYIMLKKTLMQRQARMFRNASLVRDVMSTWKTTLSDRRDETSKTVDALWHWAMALQGRCFDDWRRYVKERVRKKRRYDHAMDARRSYIIREGCVKMLKYHSDAIAYRTQFEAYQQAKARYSAYHLAWKYGKRWIGKVRAKMMERNLDCDISDDRILFPTRSVSFDFKRRLPLVEKPQSVKPLVTKERLCSPESNFEKRFSPQKQRLAPRMPDFLHESLEREGLLQGHVEEIRSHLPFNQFHQTLASDVSFNSPAHSELVDCLPTLKEHPPTLPSALSPTSSDTLLTASHASDEPADFVSPDNRTKPSVFKSSNFVLLPPSAFNSPPPLSDPPTPPPPPLSTSDWSGESEIERKSGCSLSDSDTASSDTLTDSKESFKTFVASPSHDREELKKIHEKLQKFQELREQLKVLKQQKSVLENWIDENLSTMSNSKSLDLMSVQEEIDEIDRECSRISRELLEKRPEVENLAVRVRVLCARPK